MQEQPMTMDQLQALLDQEPYSPFNDLMMVRAWLALAVDKLGGKLSYRLEELAPLQNTGLRLELEVDGGSPETSTFAIQQVAATKIIES